MGTTLTEGAERGHRPASPPTGAGLSAEEREVLYGPDRRLDAYYYGFEATGIRKIDAILSAVAHAGKGFHHTSDWTETGGRWGPDRSMVDVIQAAANEAAAHLRPDPEDGPAGETTTRVEWGVELDDAGSTDLYHAEAGARAALADGGRLVRIDPDDHRLPHRRRRRHGASMREYGLCPYCGHALTAGTRTSASPVAGRRPTRHRHRRRPVHRQLGALGRPSRR